MTDIVLQQNQIDESIKIESHRITPICQSDITNQSNKYNQRE